MRAALRAARRVTNYPLNPFTFTFTSTPRRFNIS
jgi:hypothetical protein